MAVSVLRPLPRRQACLPIPASLIHDDLPSFDASPFRRSLPSNNSLLGEYGWTANVERIMKAQVLRDSSMAGYISSVEGLKHGGVYVEQEDDGDQPGECDHGGAEEEGRIAAYAGRGRFTRSNLITVEGNSGHQVVSEPTTLPPSDHHVEVGRSEATSLSMVPPQSPVQPIQHTTIKDSIRSNDIRLSRVEETMVGIGAQMQLLPELFNKVQSIPDLMTQVQSIPNLVESINSLSQQMSRMHPEKEGISSASPNHSHKGKAAELGFNQKLRSPFVVRDEEEVQASNFDPTARVHHQSQGQENNHLKSQSPLNPHFLRPTGFDSRFQQMPFIPTPFPQFPQPPLFQQRPTDGIHFPPQVSPSSQPLQFQQRSADPRFMYKLPKIDIQAYDGEGDILNWIFQIEHYFDAYQIPAEERVRVSFFFLRDKALQWCRWYLKAKGVVLTWRLLKEGIQERFGNREQHTAAQALSRIVQYSSVIEYQERFEKLHCLVEGVSKDFLIHTFVGGLKEEIRYDVSLRDPISLLDAFKLALRLEAKHMAVKKWGKNVAVRNINSQNLTNSGQQDMVVSQPKSVPVKRLSPNEAWEIRKKGLCYHCDDKYERGHICKTKTHFSIEGDWDMSEDYEESNIEVHGGSEEEGHVISLHAITGDEATDNLVLLGTVNQQPVTILVDSGATHNYMDPQMIEKAGLQLTLEQEFEVKVAGGRRLKGRGMCAGIQVKCQGYTYLGSFMMFPIGGYDIVLGVKWMKSFDSITLDMKNKSLTLKAQHKEWFLQGRLPGPMNVLTENQSSMCFQPYNQGYFLQFQSQIFSLSLSSEQEPELQQLLGAYDEVFQKPQSLPPSRDHDHQIPLIPGSMPVCFRPYRHSHEQKNAIALLLEDMLQQGIIRPSRSPYASPVVLVKKHDRSNCRRSSPHESSKP